MKTALINRLNYLRTRLHADFGNDPAQTVWLAAGGGTWTKISVLQGTQRPAHAALSGLLTLPTGGVVFHLLKSDWPGVKLDAVFRLGPPAAGDDTIPHPTDAPKYRVAACPDSPQLNYRRIEAERCTG